MVALAFIVSSLLVSSTWAAPTVSQSDPLQLITVDTQALLCKLPVVKNLLCPRTGASALTITTRLGTAKGTSDPSGASRFAVKYAAASRWKESTVSTSWVLPNGVTNATGLPLACPQPDADPSTYSEDCLSMVLYVPPSLTVTSGVPVLVWIHGGSFVVGSATGPGLDGSKLAVATNSIVAVVQYRLGALGFMAPSGTTNLAVKDVVNSLKFLNNVVPSFGGSASKITLAGQSSGANMIRALLAVPSASSLFRSAILQSDPMNYGFLSTTTQSALQSSFNGYINCGATDTACQNALSLDSILDAQDTLFGNAIDIDASAGNAEPIRPVRDGSLITSPLDSTAAFPSVNKPILVSSVLNEAGTAIYGNFPSALPEAAFPPICAATFGETRTDIITSSSYYPGLTLIDGDYDARAQLEKVGTDYLWKCSGWTFARNWVQHGGTAYVGLYTLGATYPGNGDVSFCTQSGVVCHQDDIMIVFGTVSSPTAAQSALTTQVQARYKAFLTSSNPNVPAYPTWTAASTSDVHVLNLGGTAAIEAGACTPSFWGSAVQYDYQVYGI